MAVPTYTYSGPTGATGGNVGADTTAQVSGTNPRGQVLGVPDTYVPPRWIEGQGPISTDDLNAARGAHPYMTTGDQQALQPMAVHQLYREADAYLPASDPSTIPDIQQRLIKAGLLDPTSAGYVPGLWGASEVAAYRSLLAEANVYGVDRNTMLDYIVAHPGFNANGIKQIMLTSPISVQQAFESAFKSSTGVKPSNDETQSFLRAWQQYETQSLTGQAQGQAAFQRNPGTAPSSLTDVSTPGDFAQQYIDTNYSGQEADVGMQHGLDLVTNLISSTKGAGG